MNVIPDDGWKRVADRARAVCPRLTASDLAECERRVDLLVAKMQNRHWIARDEARALVLGILRDEQLIPA